MPKLYSRDCDECGQPYEGRGAKYCSPECAQDAQKKESNREAEFEDIPPEGEVVVEEDHREDSYLIQAKGRQGDAPKTLEDLLELTEVDLDVWEVVKWEIRPYTAFFKHEEKQKAVRVPMYSSYVRFAKRDDRFIQSAIEKSIAKMETHSPSYTDIPNHPPLPSEKRHMMEVLIPDLHLGMLSWEGETGENYDSGIAVKRYRQAIDNLLGRAQFFGIEKILFVIGSDFFHVDQDIGGSGGATTAGTPQDTDSRRHKMIQRGCDLIVETIDKFLGVAPVQVEVCPGNHDYDESIALARYVSAWYRQTDKVEVNAEPKSRKYVQYGKNLIGFAHGDKEKIKDLPLIMATEVPKKWADTKFREIHLGHQHRRKQYQALWVNEEHGVRVRHLSSLVSPDAWHAKRGYTMQTKSAQVFMWHKKKGLQMIFDWNLTDDGLT